jgi:hypothetical protein
VAQAPSCVFMLQQHRRGRLCHEELMPRAEPFVAVVWPVIYSISGGIFIAECSCRSLAELDDCGLRGTVDACDERAEFIREPIACSPPSGARGGALDEGMCRSERGRGIFPCLAAWEQSETRCRRRHGPPCWTTSEGQRGICRYSRARLIYISA